MADKFSSVYFRLLREKYAGEIFIILSSVFAIFLEISNQGEFSIFGSVAVVLLVSYFLFIFLRNYNLTRSLTVDLQTSYSLCLGKDEQEFRDYVRKQDFLLEHAKKIRLERIFSHYRIIDIDRQFFEPANVPPSEWPIALEKIRGHFFQYVQRVPIETRLHLFLISPCPIALGLGFTIGKHRNWILYHYDSKQTEYREIEAGLSTSDIAAYEYINVSTTGNSQSDVTVIISLIAKPPTPVPHLSDETIEITLKKELASDNFYKIAVELSHLINGVAKSGRIIHLFPGVPITLGFVIGKTLDEEANISIYNHNRETKEWDLVLSFQDIVSK